MHKRSSSLFGVVDKTITVSDPRLKGLRLLYKIALNHFKRMKVTKFTVKKPIISLTFLHTVAFLETKKIMTENIVKKF